MTTKCPGKLEGCPELTDNQGIPWCSLDQTECIHGKDNAVEIKEEHHG